MDFIVVHVNGAEIPIPQLSYEDIQRIIISATVGGVTDPLGQLVSWLWDRIRELVSPIKSIVSDIWNALKDLPKNFMDFVGLVRERIVAGISWLIDNLKNIASIIKDKIAVAIEGIWNSLKEAGRTLDTIGKGLGDLLNVIRERVVEGIRTIGEQLKRIFQSMEAVGKSIGDLFNIIRERVTKGIEDIGRILDTMGKGLGDLFNIIRERVTKGIEDIGKTLRELGKDISGLFSSIRDRLTELGGKISEGFKAFERILSDIGKFIKENLSPILSRIGEGIRNIIDKVVELGKSIPDFLSSITTTISDVMGNIYGFFSEISTTLQGFINSVFEVGNKIWHSITDFASNVGELVSNFINWIAEGLRKGFEALKEITKPIWEPILGFFERLWDSIQDFARDPIGWISARLSEAWNSFVEFTKPIWEPVKNFIDSLLAGIQDIVKDPIGWISASISEAWNAFVEFTKPIWEPIKNFIDSLWTGIQDFARDPTGWIIARISEAWNSFVEFTKPIWEPIKGFLDNVGVGIQDFFSRFENYASVIVKFFTEDVPRFFSETLPKFFMEDLPNYIVNGIKFIGERLHEFGDAVVNGIRIIAEGILKVCETFVEAGRRFVEGMTSNVFPQIQKAIAEAASPHSPPKEVADLVNTFQKTMLTIISDTGGRLKRHGPVTAEVLYSAGTAAASLSAVYILSQVLGMGAEALYLTKNPGLRKLIKSVADNLGGFFIMSAVSATYTFFVLHPFLRRYWGKMFRPYLPGPEFFVEAYFRKCIDYRYYSEHMSELGYHQDFIDMYIDTHARLLTPDQLVRLMGLGLWDESRVKLHLQKLGWLGERGLPGPDDIIQVTYDLPTLENALEMKWRGYIDDEALRKIFLGRGRHPLFWEKEMKTFYKIPGASDLVTFVVRDVLDPEDFKALMRAQGYMDSNMIKEIVGHTVEMPLIGGGYGSGDWADAYWESHWRLPPMTQVFNFFNRAVVGMVSLKGKIFEIAPQEATAHVFAYATLHDYKPEPRKLTKYLKMATGLTELKLSDRDLVEALRYRVLTRIESRFVRRWGLVSEEDYKRLAIAQGIDPHIKVKTLDGKEITMVDALVNAEFLQDLLEERTALRTQIINAYVEGFNIKAKVVDPVMKVEIDILTMNVEEALRALRFRPEEASWLKAQAYIRRQIELRKDYVKSLIDDYIAGAISVEDLEKELAGYVDDAEVRSSLLALAVKKRARNTVKRQLQRLDRDILRELDTVLRLYENGFINKAEAEKFLDELVAKEIITASEKGILISISDRRRKRELTELVIRALAKRVSRGEITPEKFVAEITNLGVDKEFAEKIVEVYVPFHSLSIAGLLSYADEVPIPQELLDKKLKVLKVPSDEAEIIKLVAQRRPIMDEIRNIGYMLQTLTQNLEITPGEASGVMSALGLQPAEIEIRSKIFTSLYRYGLRKQIRKTLDTLLREQYQALAKGKDPKLITLDEYVATYRLMGYPDEYIYARAQEILATAAQIKL
ncbi:MAG: hypothetical protein QW290_08560, partial [Sulfolobales archaeon]